MYVEDQAGGAQGERVLGDIEQNLPPDPPVDAVGDGRGQGEDKDRGCRPERQEDGEREGGGGGDGALGVATGDSEGIELTEGNEGGEDPERPGELLTDARSLG